MVDQPQRPVCGLCRLIYDERQDGDTWHEGPFEDEQREREYDHLCPDCYDVVVQDEPENRDWILERYPVTS